MTLVPGSIPNMIFSVLSNVFLPYYMKVLAAHVWIVSQFFTDSGFAAMSGKNLYIVGKLGQLTETVDDHKHASFRKIRSANAVAEQRVAAEKQMLGRYVIAYAPLGVARCFNDLDFMISQLQSLVILQMSFDLWKVVRDFHVVELVGLSL